MNTVLPALLVPPSADVSSLKTFDSIDFSHATAQSEDFAQTLQGATERSQQQAAENEPDERRAGGERLPPSGKGGNAAPSQHTPVRIPHSSHKSDSSPRAAKTKMVARSNKETPSADRDVASHNAPAQTPPLPLTSPPAPATRPAQQAVEETAAATSPVIASSSAKPPLVAKSSDNVDPDPATDANSASPTDTGAAVTALASGAPSATQSQDLPDIGASGKDAGAASVGALAAVTDTSAQAVDQFAGAATTKILTGKALSPAPMPHVAAAANGAASADGPSDAASTTPSYANTAGPSEAPGTATIDTPAPAPVANPMALDLGAQAAAAIQGMTPAALPATGKPAGIPSANPVVVMEGVVAARAASGARVAAPAIIDDVDSPSSTAQQGTPDGSFGAIQALVNADGSVNANASGNPSAAAAPTLNVAQPVESAGFGRGVADQVSVMIDNNLNVAKLQVNPASLGPIEVRISLQAGHAQVWMTSHSAVTRDALQDSAAQLKDMLGRQGFGQVSVDISHRQFQERAPQSFSYARAGATDESVASAPVQSASAAVTRRSDAKLDAYA